MATRVERSRWIDYQRLDELAKRGDVRNPKGHNLVEMRASLGRFGYTEPVMLDERTSRLVSGHGRVELLLGEYAAATDGDDATIVAPPEGVEVDEDGMWLVPVTRGWSSKDDAEAGAYIVAANQLTTSGGWNDDALLSLLQEVQGAGGGLSGTGFDDADMLALLAEPAPPPEPEHVEFDTRPQLEGVEYRIVVTCRDERHQADVLARLEKEGLPCVVLMS